MNGNGFWTNIIRALLIAALVAYTTALISHEVRLSVIEGNRFTDEDARLMQDRIMMNIPPPEVRQRLDRIETQDRDYEERIRKVEDELRRRHGFDVLDKR